MDYRITNRSIYKNLSFTGFHILVFLLGSLYIGLHPSNDKYYYILLFIWFIPVLCSIVLFLEYYKIERNQEIRIEGDTLYINQAGENQQIHKDEVEKLVLSGTPSIHRNSYFRLLPFEAFHFLELTLKDGRRVYITSLTDPDLFKNFRKDPFFKDMQYYPVKHVYNGIWWLHFE